MWIAGGKIPVATSSKNGLMDARYVDVFPLNKGVNASSSKQLFKLCSLKSTGKSDGFNALLLVRSIYGAGDAMLLSVNACYVYPNTTVVNVYKLNTPKDGTQATVKKKLTAEGFNVYIEAYPNNCIDLIYKNERSSPALLEKSTDSELTDVPTY